MKKLLTSIFVVSAAVVFGQTVSSNPDCPVAENICSNNGTSFNVGIGGGAINDLPSGNNVSNPGTNPGLAGNSGCLFSNELNPNWFVINIGSSGILEFTIGSAGANGYFDWAMWPYYDNGNGTTACDDITNNLLPPVACNWNASSQGFTGMYQQGSLPAGAIQGNFEFGIPVTAGQQFVICFSNYSGLTGVNVPMTFGNDIPGNNNPNSAGVTCTPGTPDQTICLGTSATVDIVPPPTIPNPTYNWLVTTGVSNPTGGTGVIVTPVVTTDYYVEIFDNGTLSAIDTFTITVVPPPTPDAGVDQNVCLGAPIVLDGTQSDPGNPINWLFDASAVSPNPIVNFVPNTTTEDPTVAVNQTGTYLFILTEDNAICGMIHDTVEVVVSELNISAVSVDPSCGGFADGEIHITSADAIEYSFDGGNVWIADSFALTFSAGTYTVCARSALGCMKCVDVDVIDPAPVTISVSNDTTVCENGTANLFATATGGTTYLFNWDHTTNTDPSQDVNPTGATVYTVYAENENGCVSPPETITISLHPPLDGNISPFDTICPGYPTDVWANVSGGIGTPYTFVWSTSDTHTGAGNHTINVNPPVSQDYTVTITDGCETTPLILTTNVNVAPLPVPQYEVLDPEQCEPAVFHIVNTTDPAMSQYVYWWIEEEQQYVNQDTITTEQMWGGLYDMQMIVTSYQGCVDSLTFEDALEVKDKPVADFRYSPNPVLMFNTNVAFTNYSLNGHTYQWYFPGGYPSQSTQTNVHVQYPDGVAGTYDVMLITTSELGCVDTLKHELIVFPEVLVYAPNTFTPDDDEFNQDWRIYMEGIDIYDFELLIFDRWGEVVWESHDISVAWDGTYKGKLLPAGSYTWIVRTKDLLNDKKYTYNGHVNILR